MNCFRQVSHHINMHLDSTHKIPSWTLLTYELSASVRLHEGGDIDVYHFYMCGRCPPPLRKLRMWSDHNRHLSEVYV